MVLAVGDNRARREDRPHHRVSADEGPGNPSDVLSVRARIDMEGPEWYRVVYHRLRSKVESLKRPSEESGHLRQTHLTGAEEHLYPHELHLQVVYAVAVVAALVGRPELRHSIAYFA